MSLNIFTPSQADCNQRFSTLSCHYVTSLSLILNIYNKLWLFITLWLQSQSNVVELWRDHRWVHLDIIMLRCILAVAHTPWCEKAILKAWPPTSFFFIAIAVVNISPQFLKAQVKPDQEPTQVFIPFLLILFTLTGFLFSDLSIQNRHFLSALSVHFASIGIRVVSMFWVISSSVLYNTLTWPTNTLTSLASRRNFCCRTIPFVYQNIIFSRAKRERTSQWWGQLSKQHICFHQQESGTNKGQPHVTSPGRSQSNMIKAKSPTLHLTAEEGELFNGIHDVFLPQDVPRSAPACLTTSPSHLFPFTDLTFNYNNAWLCHSLCYELSCTLAVALWTGSWWQHSRPAPSTAAC